MQIQKTKLAIAIGSLGLFMGAAQVANAGLVEVNVSTSKVSTFSTDISGPGSDNQPFFAPDVRWTPGQNIDANSTVRFNLGGQTGNPARFATNGIDVNNFYLTWGGTGFVPNAWAAAPAATLATGTGVVTPAEALSLLGVAANASQGATGAQIVVAINAGLAAADAGAGNKLLKSLDATSQALFVAAVDGAAGITAGTGAALVTAMTAIADATAESDNVFASASTRIAVGSYTNGDSATWFKNDGSAFGRIFQSTTAGGINSFDVTVFVNVALRGSASPWLNASVYDTVTLSLNTGKYVDNVNAPAKFDDGTLLDTSVDITNLKQQSFDVKDKSIDVIVSVAQGGQTRDILNGNNRTRFASSAEPLTFSGFIGMNGGTAAATLPTTINTADSEKLFSVPAAWYSNALSNPGVAYNHIGSMQYNVASLATGITYDPFGHNAAGGTGAVGASNASNIYTQVSDPIGNQYALTAGDVIKLDVAVVDGNASSLAAFTAANALFLRPAPGDCTGVFNSGAGDVGLTTNAATWTASSTNAALVGGTMYTVCARANTTTEIQPITLRASATLDNVEPTYQDPVLTPATLGTWGRNGCSVTFFNVPGNGPAASNDKAFLRFTNTTTSSTPGTVRVKVYGQDGAVKGDGSSLIVASAGAAGTTGTLTAHQTGVYNAHDVARAIGLAPADDAANAWAGERVRVVMSGGFNTCEGQNMINAAGTLINATTTTNANSNTADLTGNTAGFNGNNTN